MNHIEDTTRYSAPPEPREDSRDPDIDHDYHRERDFLEAEDHLSALASVTESNPNPHQSDAISNPS